MNEISETEYDETKESRDASETGGDSPASAGSSIEDEELTDAPDDADCEPDLETDTGDAEEAGADAKEASEDASETADEDSAEEEDIGDPDLDENVDADADETSDDTDEPSDDADETSDDTDEPSDDADETRNSSEGRGDSGEDRRDSDIPYADELDPESLRKMEDLKANLKEINPNFDPYDYESPYNSNCGSCAKNVDRMLDGKGLEPADARTLSISEMNEATGKQQVEMSPDEIADYLRSQGPDSHAVVGIDRADGPGHWFNAYTPDGEHVYCVDGQSGEITGWPPDYGNVTNWDVSVDTEGYSSQNYAKPV